MSQASPRHLRIQLAGQRQRALERGRNRLMVVGVMFAAVVAAYTVRMVYLGVLEAKPPRAHDNPALALRPNRADIIDRNGMVLARALKVSSLYVNPSEIRSDRTVLAQNLARIFPDQDVAWFKRKLTGKAKFRWLRRKITPAQWQQVFDLGEPGLNRLTEYERFYPNRSLAAHVLGYVDVDGNGIAGLELTMNDRLVEQPDKPLRLSIDARAQHALTDSLLKAMIKHSAIGASGLIMDVRDGSLVALVSLPDYNPNVAGTQDPNARFNRATLGVYELGSTFKAFTVAMGLEAGTFTIRDGYDCTRPLRVARFTIRDDHPKKRYLTVPEIFKYSSNIGTAQMADALGADRQREYMGRFGLLSSMPIELSESGRPILPEPWGRLATMTVGYGHGLAVTQLHLAAGYAALVNGGVWHPPTLLAAETQPGRRVLSPAVSDEMRALLRLVVKHGTGSKADAAGFRVGGKTGTAEKPGAGGYRRKALISTFAGVYPMDNPRYVVIASLDEPQGTKDTFGFAAAGWVTAPVVKDVVLRTAGLLGVEPSADLDVDLTHLDQSEAARVTALQAGGGE